MPDNTSILKTREAIRNYSHALQLQQDIERKVHANPGELLSFEEIARYLKAVSQEREAEQNIYAAFEGRR